MTSEMLSAQRPICHKSPSGSGALRRSVEGFMTGDFGARSDGNSYNLAAAGTTRFWWREHKNTLHLETMWTLPTFPKTTAVLKVCVY